MQPTRAKSSFSLHVEAHPHAPSVLAVVVLYKTLPEHSETMLTLESAAAAVAPGDIRLRVAIVDNTPGGQEIETLPETVHYRAAINNPGLATAYNAALAAAAQDGYEWLLTLDQDTDLPGHFLTAMLPYLDRFREHTQVGAIVPHIMDGGRYVSPLRFVGGFLPSVLPADFDGVAMPFTSALNSASLLRTEALLRIGGYDERFPLNNSDTSLFHKLGRAGLSVAVAGDVLVQHELAIMNRGERMTLGRYQQLLADERAFWDLEMSVLGRVERLLRLVGRWAKDRYRGLHPEFRAATLREIRLRLMTRRRARVAHWKQNFSH